MPGYDYELLREQLDNPENWQSAALPRGSNAIQALRSIYDTVSRSSTPMQRVWGPAMDYGRSVMAGPVVQGAKRAVSEIDDAFAMEQLRKYLGKMAP